MSEKIEVFQYPIQYRVISVVAPMLFIFSAVGVSLVAWQNMQATNWVAETGILVNPIVFYMAVTAAICLATFFGACIHLTYPAILKNNAGFKVETHIYSSRWFTWDEITKVGLPPSQLVTQIYSIGVPALHPIFWAIGLSRGMLAPGFLIHPRMINGGKLLRTIIKHRPELFEE